jgi:hypothetical protein
MRSHSSSAASRNAGSCDAGCLVLTRVASDLHAVMHLRILEPNRSLTGRYVANWSHCCATRIEWAETGSVSGTDKSAGALMGQLFGPGAIPLSNIGSMGGECGPLGRRHSGKGRAVPVRRPSIVLVS